MTDTTIEPPSLEEDPPRLSFEDPGKPFLQGFLDTLRLFIVNPREAYGRMWIEADLLRPLIFALIFGLYRAVVDLFWLRFFSPWQWFGSDSPLAGLHRLSSGFVGLIVTPILLIVLLFVIALLVHLFLIMLEAGQRGFHVTFRVTCYASAAQLAVIVPFVGGLVSAVWWLVLMVLGVSIAHRTSTERAAAGVLLPFVLCCACCGGLMLFGLLLGSAG